jgi:hypothetical protein
MSFSKLLVIKPTLLQMRPDTTAWTSSALVASIIIAVLRFHNSVQWLQQLTLEACYTGPVTAAAASAAMPSQTVIAAPACSDNHCRQ